MMSGCPSLLYLNISLPIIQLDEIAQACPKLVHLRLCPEWHFPYTDQSIYFEHLGEDSFRDLVKLTIQDSCCKPKGLHMLYTYLRKLPKLKYLTVDPGLPGACLLQLQQVFPHLQPSKPMRREVSDMDSFIVYDPCIEEPVGVSYDEYYTERTMRGEFYDWARPWAWTPSEDNNGRNGREAFFKALFEQPGAMSREELQAWDNENYEYESSQTEGIVTAMT
jgi:hypothetical protein